ncbi:MAG: exodeoxyribonuclease VII large subunit [Deltaproteobacteria bacterium]|nr:exodeoxyribonuclease VII large subunit [Deltaproteobacteria bacterium]
MQDILTVTELTANIKILLETSFETLWVAGEISNLRRPGSGHVYCTLKDQYSQIRAVIFRHAMQKIGFDLEDGMEIVCRATINVYQARGEYQLIIDAAEPRGYGALQMAFEQLKRKLDEEGLFDPSSKKRIPFLPRRIGIVTSSTGAAIRDILNITERRFSSVDILIAPVRVQGVEAPLEICEAISNLNSIPGIDVIIVTRGGGSLEDLFPFNDERVARAINASEIPIISAVGHEIDFTIADFVADLRAPTPSAAAELVVPQRRELIESLEKLDCRLLNNQRKTWRMMSERMTGLRARVKDPRRQIVDLRMQLDDAGFALKESVRRGIENRKTALLNTNKLLSYMSPATLIREFRFRLGTLDETMGARILFFLSGLKNVLKQTVSVLNIISPLSILERGYGIVKRLPDNSIVKDAKSLTEGCQVSVRVLSGSFKAKVTKIFQE